MVRDGIANPAAAGPGPKAYVASNDSELNGEFVAEETNATVTVVSEETDPTNAAVIAATRDTLLSRDFLAEEPSVEPVVETGEMEGVSWAEYAQSKKRMQRVFNFDRHWRACAPAVRDAFRPLSDKANVWKQWTGGHGDVSHFSFDEVQEFANALRAWCRLEGDMETIAIADAVMQELAALRA